MDIRTDTLSHPAVTELLTHHLECMRRVSPPDSCHALCPDELRAASVTFWTLWWDGALAGCAALKEIDPSHGEVKSMRTVEAFLQRGVAARLLTHLIDEAQRRGYRQLSLETGSLPYFEPARALYVKFGFQCCPPFADYRDDPYSVYMTRRI